MSCSMAMWCEDPTWLESICPSRLASWCLLGLSWPQLPLCIILQKAWFHHSWDALWTASFLLMHFSSARNAAAAPCLAEAASAVIPPVFAQSFPWTHGATPSAVNARVTHSGELLLEFPYGSVLSGATNCCQLAFVFCSLLPYRNWMFFSILTKYLSHNMAITFADGGGVEKTGLDSSSFFTIWWIHSYYRS